MINIVDLEYEEDEEILFDDIDPDAIYCEECGSKLESFTEYHNIDCGQVEEYLLHCPFCD